MLREGELIPLSPERILEIGLRELKREQQIFFGCGQEDRSGEEALEVFKAIQKDHPTEENLIPDTRKNLEAIRQFLINRNISPSRPKCGRRGGDAAVRPRDELRLDGHTRSL